MELLKLNATSRVALSFALIATIFDISLRTELSYFFGHQQVSNVFLFAGVLISKKIGDAMTKEAKRYTEEYRKETADYALSCDKSITQIARELGINQATLNRWVLSRRKELEPGSATLPIHPR